MCIPDGSSGLPCVSPLCSSSPTITIIPEELKRQHPRDSTHSTTVDEQTDPGCTKLNGQFQKVFRSHPPLPHPLRPPLMLLLLLLIVLLMAPHGLASDTCDLSKFKNNKDNRYIPPPKRYLYHKNTQEKLTLTLETSQRTSQRITTAIFKIFLKELLNFQDVEIVHVNDEEFNGWTITNKMIEESSMSNSANKTLAMTHYDNISDSLVDDIDNIITENGIPTTMINLEVWLPPGTVETSGSYEVDKGSQGSGGRFGWYVSSHSIRMNNCITDHWRSYQYEKCSSIFSLTPEEDNQLKENYTKVGDGYYCNESFCSNGIFTPEVCRNNNNCSTLFAGDYKKYSKFLVDQIKHQNLRVRVAWIGPHLSAHFIETFRKSKPIVFFGWWPDSLSNLDGFIPISFKPCSDYRSATRGDETYACKYELHPLKKHMWKDIPKIDQNIPVAVEKFSLSIEDYRQLLTMYNEEHKFPLHHHNHDDNEIIDDIACRWLQREDHNNKLNNWLPPQYSSKIKLWIGGIFPMSAKSDYQQSSLLHAAGMAKVRINNNPDVLSDYELEIINDDGKCQSDMVLKAFITYTKQGIDNDYGLNKIKFDQMIGVLGPSCSDTVEPLVGVAKHFSTVIVSYSAEGAIFNNREKYPYFFRTIPGNKMYSKVYPLLFSKLEWKQVASLSEDNNKYSEYLTLLEDYLIQRNMSIENRRFPREARVDLTIHLQRLKKSNHRIIIGDFYATTAKHVLCQAYQHKMTSKYGYVWFLPRWFHADWYKNNETSNEGDGTTVDCTTHEMEEAINGTLSLGYAYYADNNTKIEEGITVKEWHEKWNDRMCRPGSYFMGNCKELPNYAGYTYDAVWTYAYALDKLLKEDKSHAVNMHSNKTNTRFVKLIDETDFMGVSGRIKFHDGPSRQTNVNVMQLQVEDGKPQYVTVGFYDYDLDQGINKDGLNLNLSKIRWQTSDGKKPDDGSPPEQSCLFSSISDALGVNCEMAIFISMLFGFAVITIIVFAAFIVFKKNMEKRIPPPGTRLWDSLDEWEIPREKVVINRTIGEGAFGTVFGGECQFTDNGPWQAVAVKTLKVGSTIEEKLDFLSEAEMMKRFSHKNIVELLGVCTHHEPIYMIMEFMLYGDLKTYLLARRHLVTTRTLHGEDDEVGAKRLTSMALDVAKALDYLSEQKYVHRDVACRNCLVSAERTVKLSDFGMTRAMYESDYYRFNRKAMLPVRWMSPESLEDGVFTCKSDMWSFGVLLYEIITFGNFPFQGMSNNQVLEHVCQGHTLALPNGVRSQLSRLLRSCWALDPNERPKFSHLVDHLSMNPRLITPCLEVPLASVQTDTDSLVVTDQSNHRGGVPPRPPAPSRVRNYSGDNSMTPNNIGNHLNNLSPMGTTPMRPPLEITQVTTHSDTGGTTTTSFTVPNIWNNGSYNCNHNRASHINGGGSSIEPLLPQNGENYIAKYVCLQRSKSGESPVTIETPNITSV